MKPYNHIFFAIILICSFILFSSCQKEKSSYKKIEPAKIEHIEGSSVEKLTLTEKAAERIGIKTAKVSSAISASGKTVPYAAVLYDIEGKTWVYTNPSPLVYVRAEIDIDFIKDKIAVLKDGPQVGTSVVVQGASELLGTEYHVGH